MSTLRNGHVAASNLVVQSHSSRPPLLPASPRPTYTRELLSAKIGHLPLVSLLKDTHGVILKSQMPDCFLVFVSSHKGVTFLAEFKSQTDGILVFL